MSNRHAQLAKELRAAGAGESEIPRLSETAAQLRQLKASPPTLVPKQWIWRRRLVSFGSVALVAILLGSGIVAYAQTSLPGSWLYPAKRLSENVAVAFDPGYRATLMMRRSEEVRVLIDHHAASRSVLATLADYQSEAGAYKSPNYAAFEYCKSNLEQAALTAPGPERDAINSTLSSLRA